MSDEDPFFYGIQSSAWRGAFRLGLPEFSASNFVFSSETPELIRIAFGNQGPYISDHKRDPVYTVAVTLPPEIAVELARLLLKFYAQPKSDRSISSGDL